jgi:uncharacterized glyoxalase superfamily protein PhnB
MESMIQLYVEESGKALEFYKKAFDAKVHGEIHWQPESESVPEHTVIVHAELCVFDQIIAVSDVDFGIGETTVWGNNYQICFRGLTVEKIDKIYEVLKENAISANPPGSLGYSDYGFGITDKYGVHWVIFK